MSNKNEVTVPVNTPSRAYDVHVGRGILDSIGKITRASAGGSRACVITETNVRPLYGARVESSLAAAGYEVSTLTFPAGEQNKRLSTLEGLLEGLAEAALTRDDVVIALGGGVTGDMAGLAAAMYLRGIQVVQAPTSLLAMVDSSVGGKVAVDLAHGKNLCGFFWQPSAVVADVECLHTISPELYTDSIGEVVKHAVLADPQMLADLTDHPMNGTGYPDELVTRIVAKNIQIKRDVVNADEKERGLRQTLNLGHTIGHGIEAASDFALGHGSCVAAGLCCMARAACAKGWCKPGTRDAIVAAMAAQGLPTDTALAHDVIFDYMTHDKKRHGDSMNIVVPDEIGRVSVRKVTLAELRELVDLGCGCAAGNEPIPEGEAR
ncbi:3-dehydroquinate synthase [Paratractidigestivibacter sp.]|uniref:3-dehydroquinate synthase n=1 Tax=Paratractidigestivibacter sp. TaxID=2847316 RepID=UPI002AC9CC65|nr:3-dehydroquinate synthase [Paratractidigestivibacter sp.]